MDELDKPWPGDPHHERGEFNDPIPEIPQGYPQDTSGPEVVVHSEEEQAIRPFTVSLSNGELAISSGRYQSGATGDWTDVQALAATPGSYAYFVIQQSASRAVTSVALEVSGGELDAVTVTGDPATSFTSRVLLGWVDGGELKQVRTGNFLLGLWQIDGEVVRWSETTGGGS